MFIWLDVIHIIKLVDVLPLPKLFLIYMNFSKTTFFTEHLWVTASPIDNQISVLETKHVFEVAYFSLTVNCCHRQQFPLCFIMHILSLKESTCEIRKNVFSFTSKVFLVLENQILEFYKFKFHDVTKCLLNNLGSKLSLLMKFGQFRSYYKTKKNYQKILQKLLREN